MTRTATSDSCQRLAWQMVLIFEGIAAARATSSLAMRRATLESKLLSDSGFRSGKRATRKTIMEAGTSRAMSRIRQRKASRCERQGKRVWKRAQSNRKRSTATSP